MDIFINVSKIQTHIDNGLMWINSEGKWCKRCPSCNKEIIGKDGTITTKFNVSHSIIIGQVCHSCIKIGKPTWSSTHKEEWSKRISGENHPFYGKHHTDAMKKKQAERNTGKKLSDETKRKLRILTIEQHRKNGISFPCVDGGAIEYFDNMNTHDGFHIQHPNVEIRDLGYFVDGYDPILHAIFEYDTKVHNSGRYKKKDFKRQREIIKYYKSIGNPLNAFYRINQTGVGQEGMINVLTTEDK
jgi:hypothetical protein